MFKIQSRARMLFLALLTGVTFSVPSQVRKNYYGSAAGNASAGWTAFEGGRLEEARSLLLRAVQQEPGHADYQAALGIIELQVGDRAEGTRHLRTAIQLSPANTEYRLRLAGAYQVEGKDLEVLKLLDVSRVDQAFGDDWHFTKGFSLFRVGRLAKAEDEFAPLAAKPQFMGPANFFLGNIAFSENDFDKAVRYYAVAVRSGYTESNIAYNAYLYDYGLALFRLGRFVEAKEQFQASVGRYDKDPLPWMYLGRCEQLLGNYKVAIDMLERSIAIDPKFVLAYYELARLQKKYGDPERAERLFATIASMKQEEVAAEEKRAQKLKMGDSRP